MMNQFKKMILLPKAEYDRLKSNVAPVESLKTILSNSVYPTDELKRIHGAHYINQQTLLQQPTEATSHEPVENKFPWSQTLPESFWPQGEHLLIRLKPELSWNEQGTIKLKSGEEVFNSNIQDLLHFLIRNRRSTPPPLGFFQLLPVLKKLNLPRELVSNPKAYKHLYSRELNASAAVAQALDQIDEPPLLRLPSRKRTRQTNYFEWPAASEK